MRAKAKGKLFEFPPEPPELEGLSQDELRFWRLIEERESDKGGEVITLACGHTPWVVGLSPRQQYMACVRCFENWVEVERQQQSTSRTTSFPSSTTQG